MPRPTLIVSLSALLVVLLAGCAPPPYTAPDTGTAASTEPGIRVTWPLPEATVVGCTVATVEVTNLTLTDSSTNTEPVEGQGHYHIFTPAGYTAAWTPYALVSFGDMFETLEDDPVGDVLTVQLVNNIHELMLDADGDAYEFEVPLVFTPGECTEFGATPTDTSYDTSMAAH